MYIAEFIEVGNKWLNCDYFLLNVIREKRFFLQHKIMPPAAAAAKSLQSCPTLCDPIDVSPPGSPAPGILQARTLEWVAISFSKIMPPVPHVKETLPKNNINSM